MSDIYSIRPACALIDNLSVTACIKELLHWAICFATCLAILLRYKLHEKLPSVTYPEMNMSRNFFGAAIVARRRRRFYFSQPFFPALRTGVTLGNVACNLSRNGATKSRDKLQEKLPRVLLRFQVKMYGNLN